MGDEPRDLTSFEAALRALAAERSGEELLYAPPGSPAPPALAAGAPRPLFSHVSDCVELGLVREGSVLMATPGQLVRLTPGRLFVLGHGVWHAELPGNSVRPHRTFWVHLRADHVYLAESSFDPARGLRLIPELLVASPPHAVTVGQAICAELAERGVGYAQAVFGLLTYLSSLLLRNVRRGRILDRRLRESPLPRNEGKAWRAVEAALEYCQENFRRGITREDVARAVGYSPGHLGHLVATHLGQSLSDHLHSLRLSEAKRLLEESDLSIRHIAALVGYADPAHFTRAFTRRTGGSPTAYRRQAQTR